ncbi:response regulator [Muricauda sp. TY007]|uniref:response regulator n=1 Tax=Allomuricauda sp. TY007 TaxID=2683200 RepID=UPI0013C0105C|nr:response regulator [Muricauda sp. TY007]NDV16833.1 response regulator [Muricauda sp. TY007]
MDFIIENYKWIFSGIGVIILGWVGKLFFSRIRNGGMNNITINNNLQSKPKDLTKPKNETRTKGNCHILFIDDQHNDFKMVSILKKAGWINTKAIKDLTDLDDYKVKVADIVFVDINGVGTTMFEDQGLGLAAALKEKYPNKTIILYSAEPTGNRFNKKLRMVDNSLPKNAEPYEFISLIEQYS